MRKYNNNNNNGKFTSFITKLLTVCRGYQLISNSRESTWKVGGAGEVRALFVVLSLVL